MKRFVLQPMSWCGPARLVGLARSLAAAAPAALVLAAVATPAAAAPGMPAAPISAGTRLAANCAACHGTAGAATGSGAGASASNGSIAGGSSNTGSALPSLAGQSREALSSSLRAFKAGSRPSTIMSQIAKGYTDEQIELLAAYFAMQKKEN